MRNFKCLPRGAAVEQEVAEHQAVKLTHCESVDVSETRELNLDRLRTLETAVPVDGRDQDFEPHRPFEREGEVGQCSGSQHM